MICGIDLSFINSDGGEAIQTKLNSFFLAEEGLVFLNRQILHKNIFLLQVRNL